MINSLKWGCGVLYYRRVDPLRDTGADTSNDFFLVPQSARPDFRRQQHRIPARAAAARPQGNHADFFVGTDDFASDPN